MLKVFLDSHRNRSFRISMISKFRCLAGGNSNIFYFHPEKMGKMIQIDYIIFLRWVVEQPPTRCNFSGSLTQKELPGRVGQIPIYLGCEVVQTIPTIGFNVETVPTSFDETYRNDVSVSPMRGRGGFSRMHTFFVAQPRPSLMTSHSVFMFHLLCPPLGWC